MLFTFGKERSISPVPEYSGFYTGRRARDGLFRIFGTTEQVHASQQVSCPIRLRHGLPAWVPVRRIGHVVPCQRVSDVERLQPVMH